ncbi:MAG: response regulator [bacterium]
MEMKDIKIILVDDDSDFGGSITKGLISIGYNVHYQTSLLSLENIINDFRPNILFLDVEIGDLDSIEETTQFATLFPMLPIVYISSHTEGSYHKRAFNKGGVAYIKKPIKLDEIEAYIEMYAKPFANEITSIGNITFKMDTRKICNIETNETASLNTQDAALLKFLIANKGVMVSFEEIDKKVWGGKILSNNVFNNSLSRLRKTLRECSNLTITTIHSTGYILSVNVEKEI